MSNPKDSEFNRKAYDLWSKQYDLDANSTVAVDDAHFPVLWQHISGKVLEIGCGTGRHTVRLAQAGNRVVAIEPSEGMLEVARGKITGGSVEFIRGDFLTEREIPINDFDAVIVSLVLEHIEDLALFFNKAVSHMKPGGRLFMSEIHPERIAGGSQAHFVDPTTAEEVRLRSFAHSDSAIKDAAKAVGLILNEAHDIFGSRALAGLNPGWDKYLGRPMIRIWIYEKP